MGLKISPALQAKIERIAAQRGRDSESLIEEALQRLEDYDEWFVREVEKGLAQVDNGQVLDHSEVTSRTESLIAEKQRRG